MTRAREFLALHAGPVPLLLPNAWDVASALAFVAAGCPAVGTTSLGVAAAAGLPDATRAARAATLELSSRLGDLPVPVTVDLEDGYADEPEAVADLVVGLPAAGVNLEDGTAGRLVCAQRHAEKIAAVEERCPDVFVNARTDTFWLGQAPTVEETVRRASRYVDAGADGIFVPGRLTEEEIGALVTALPVPVNVLATPDHTLPRLAALGVRRVSTGSLLFRAAIDEATAVVRRLAVGDPAPRATSYGAVDARTVAHGRPADGAP